MKKFGILGLGAVLLAGAAAIGRRDVDETHRLIRQQGDTSDGVIRHPAPVPATETARVQLQAPVVARSEADERRETVRDLALQPSAGAVALLRQTASEDPDRNVRAEALAALGACVGKPGGEGIMAFLARRTREEPDPGLRRVAMDVLSRAETGVSLANREARPHRPVSGPRSR